MNRSAPLDAQETQAAIETAGGGARSFGSLPKAASVAAAVLALAVLGYATLWAGTALQLRSEVLDWIAARQAEGYRVAYSRIGISGFPIVARVRVKAPALAAPDGRALSWSWVGGQAVVEVNPLRRNAAVVRLLGEAIVSINVEGKLRTYRGGADEMTVTLRRALGAGAGTLSIRNLVMNAEEPGDAIEIERLFASAEPSERRLSSSPARAHAVMVEGADIELPRQMDLPLGQSVAHLSVRALVAGAFVPTGEFPAALARWRNSGGMAEVSHLSLSYGPLFLEGSGTASLDAEMQPAGTFVARIQGFQQALSALAGRGMIEEQAAANASIALAILGQPSADGGPASMSVPLTLQDRRLSVGPLPLMVVPLIEWPRGPSPRSGAVAPLPGAVGG